MSFNSPRKCELAFKIFCDLGEGPVWDKKNNRIFWVDITRGHIHWLFPDSGEHKFCPTAHQVGAITLTKTGRILAALQIGLAYVNIENGLLEVIKNVESDSSDNRFNDGKCDPAGRFWIGTMSMSGKANAGSLYTIEHDFSVSTKIKGVGISNGLAWSPDNANFYYIDTVTNCVAAYDYDNTNGNIKNRRIVVEMSEEEGFLDGMTIDTEGMLWIALWDGWKVGRWNPRNGKLIDIISLPVARPTSCVFGGPDLQDLYITSARQGLSEKELNDQPLAGSLFVLKDAGYHGIPGNEYINL